MKVRQGFVSNSSSQSFVIRGIKIDTKKLSKLCEITWVKSDTELSDLFTDVQNHVTDKLDGYTVEPTGCYFGDVDYKEVIVGKELESLEDGCATEYDNKAITAQDKKIVEDFKQIGIDIDEKDLSLFVQYISNDNF